MGNTDQADRACFFSVVSDVCLIVGFLLLAYGFGELRAWLGLIVAGVEFVALAAILELRTAEGGERYFFRRTPRLKRNQSVES